MISLTPHTMESSQSGMGNLAPRVIQPVRIEPEKEQGGREGRAEQNLRKQGPLPPVAGIHFPMPPLCKDSFHTALIDFCLLLILCPSLPLPHSKKTNPGY